jgi:hypothetical protein
METINFVYEYDYLYEFDIECAYQNYQQITDVLSQMYDNVSNKTYNVQNLLSRACYVDAPDTDTIELLCRYNCKLEFINHIYQPPSDIMKILLRYNALSSDIHYKHFEYNIDLAFYIAIYYPDLIYLVEPFRLVSHDGISLYSLINISTYLSHASEYGWVISPCWLLVADESESELIINALYAFIFYKKLNSTYNKSCILCKCFRRIWLTHGLIVVNMAVDDITTVHL